METPEPVEMTKVNVVQEPRPAPGDGGEGAKENSLVQLSAVITWIMTATDSLMKDSFNNADNLM